MKYVSLVLLALSLSFSAHAADKADPDADFDRLDGTGASGKRVDVIEWEGNLEIHVYPQGSLKGLALKEDDTNKDKPVMVIGYRFTNAPATQLIRRAILSKKLPGFKAYRDTSDPEFDKIIISSNTLSGDLAAYALEPAPTQLYPDGHPALANAAAPAKDSARKPAAAQPSKAVPAKADPDDEDGSIKSFFSE